jgi:topoisomerase-4 subunit A
MSKKDNITPSYVENISIEPMDTVMDTRSALYAKDVIQDRAIPDVRDGLKPVQRRIIYAMYRANNTFDKPTRKCAGIVGDVMGKYHPHGDSSIYDALVRMSQDWKMEVPLIKFQGNNGSIDNDPAAAYRYTEAKLNQFSSYLVNDIDKDTVDMTLNFDDTLFEPVVLPVRFPNLFVNGGSGIAFAIATEIPPHNLVEMCEATIHRINHPNCSLDDLLEIVKGPDFPTGGIIYNSTGLKDIYSTGRGKIDLAADVDIDTSDKNINRLIIHSVPFGVVKIDLVYSIDKIRKSKEIDGILEVIDETAGDIVKIVVTLKKEIDPEVVLKYLLSRTQLKISYSANIVAISNNSPRILPLIDYLDDFISFQEDVIVRRSKFDLAKAEERVSIVEGLIKAVSIVNEVVDTIKASKDKEDSKKNLISKFGFTEPQAEAIVMMHLYRLSNTDVTTYIEEKKSLDAIILDLKETLASPIKVKHIIIDDLKDISKKFGVARKTKIVDDYDSRIVIDKRALIIKEDCYVTLSVDGYINRASVKSHDASNNQLPTIKEGDCFVMSALCNTMDYILAFTNKGNYIFIPVCDIDEGKYKDQGKHINYISNLPFDEYIIKSIIVRDFAKKANICLVSKNGQIKKSLLSDFQASRNSKPITCMRLGQDDEVVDVTVLSGNSNILILTEKGNLTYFNENEISCTGLKSSGVKAISTLKNSTVKAVFGFRKDEKNKVLLITDNKMYRLYDNNNAEVTARLGKTQFAFKSFKSDLHLLVYAQKILSKDQPINLYCLMGDNSVINYSLNDFYLTPIDKYCKANMELNSNQKIKSIYQNNVDLIDENFIEEKGKNPNDGGNNGGASPIVSESKDTKKEVKKPDDTSDDKKKDDNYEQISIFDDMGD